MKISKRVNDIKSSVTLKLNARANELIEQGEKVYNLTAGQLPFTPPADLIRLIKEEANNSSSYQYSPVTGVKKLRDKILNYYHEIRKIDFLSLDDPFDVIISDGGKHSLFNVISSIVEPDDEVIILAPYWVSYPQMINYCQGKTKVVISDIFNGFVPKISDITNAITDKTKAIIINSPNNPTGVHYSSEWMEEFAELMLKHKNVIILSDEIYHELSYFDPAPDYFYQSHPELLERTVIFDGASKSLACTGLRIGYAMGPTSLLNNVSKLQGHTTSGANSLIQNALNKYDFSNIESFLKPIKVHLRDNARVVRDSLRQFGLPQCWYQTTSAMYFMLDFSKTKRFESYRKSESDSSDYSELICSEILDKLGVAIVPGTDFGLANSARISLTLEVDQFKEAVDKISEFLSAEC